MFKIVNMNLKEDYLHDDEIVLFETGKEAAAYAERLTARSYNGHKFAGRPYSKPSDDWKQREQGRFDSGEYIRVPAEIEKHCLPDHFVHVAAKNPEKIAFTASPEKGIEDKQKLSSVLGYLQRFAPDMDDDEREALDDMYSDMFSTYELKFAKTADEIENVYTYYDSNEAGVAASCMRHENDDEFISQEHPVRVYGDSDLQVAFIANDKGETAARAIVWPTKKIYSRVYGGDVSANKLHRLLKKEGYQKSHGYYDDEMDYDDHDENLSLKGALIQAIPYNKPNKVNAHVMPYIDEYCDVGLVTIDGKQWMRIGNEGFHCQGTSGLTHEDDELNGSPCDACGERVEDESTLTPVHYDRWNIQQWCECCTNDAAFHCEGTDEYYSHYSYLKCVVDNDSYCEAYAKSHFVYCPECNEYHREALLKVFDEAGDKLKMCQSCFDSEYGDKWKLDTSTGWYVKEHQECEIVMKADHGALPGSVEDKAKLYKRPTFNDIRGIQSYEVVMDEFGSRAARELSTYIDNEIITRLFGTLNQ